MNRRRQRQIEDIAKATLQELGCYPLTSEGLFSQKGIDVIKVAHLLGIESTTYDFGDDVSGMLVRDGSKATIGYSIRTGEKRQRFTIAHELGHYILNHRRQGVFVDTPEKYFTLFRDGNSSTGEDAQEREANAFAASLLMPKELLVEAVTDLYSTESISRDEEYDIVEELAKGFNVSKLAMSIRLTNLDLLW